MDNKQFREYGKELIDFIGDYFENIEQSSIKPDVKPGFLLNKLPSSAPSQGEQFQEILADYQEHVMPGILGWNNPNFHAYFPASISYPSILGELLAAATGGVGFEWSVNPSYTELEIVVTEWLGKLLNLPKQFIATDPSQGQNGKWGGGVIQSTASESVVVAMLAARKRALDRLKEKSPDECDSVLMGKLVAYSSVVSHSSIMKAKLVCATKIHLIETDDQGVIDVELLIKTIKEDVQSGLIPFFFADSFNLNAHKLMLTNFDCSPFWVKDRNALMNALSVEGSYFKDDDTGVVTDFRKWQIPLGRRFRALKLWFVLRTYGMEGVQRHVREHIERTKLFETLIAQDVRFEFWPRKPNLGLVCFRIKGADELTKSLSENINAGGQIALSAMQFKKKIIIRFHGGLGNDSHVHNAWNVIKNETDKLLKQNMN
ncbi:aromatic-L-amino-acid decarboxylase [Exaiptasia diaphana]|uniref:Aromatic-L-amino-acid decarboxylase n=1 Tax=Exaiptasia diaphana TaxID=2652724 RepID=A0A913XHM2_EXADI|nr:aromatic-L-amino-acid decarboxylase [Exaiptasia diaphana]